MEKYANLPFMPQKNDESDRRDILSRSKEFNPVVSFPILDAPKPKAKK